jgi:hypothetical protein
MLTTVFARMRRMRAEFFVQRTILTWDHKPSILGIAEQAWMEYVLLPGRDINAEKNKKQKFTPASRNAKPKAAYTRSW